MANWQDVARILGKDKNPQEQQVIQEYLAKLEANNASFSGGDTLSIDRLEARTGDFVVYPFEGIAVVAAASNTLATTVAEDITWEFATATVRYGKMFGSGATTDLTIYVPGVYVCSCTVVWGTRNTGALLQQTLYKNGSTLFGQAKSADMNVQTTSVAIGMTEFEKGDTINVEVAQYTGGDLTVITAYLSCWRVR